jgi:hypothetical protein
MSSIKTYNVLDAIAGSSADVAVVNGSLKVTGAPTIPFNSIIGSALIDNMTEVREVVTLTPTAASAVGQAYTIRVQQFNNSLKRTVSKVFSYTSITASDSRLVISTAMAAILNLDSELAITAAVGGSGGSETITITADSGSPELTVTIISVGAGLTQATTFLDAAGSAVTPATTYTVSTTSNVTTFTRATGGQLNFAAGMFVTFTLGGSDSVTFRDGTVISAGSSVTLRIGGTVTNGASAGAFDVGITTDSRLSGISISTAPTVSAAVTFARGNNADMASKGLTGYTTTNNYAELLVKYNDVNANGGIAISKEHSVYFNAGDADYATMRTTLLNLLGGGTAASATTANPEAVAIG